MPGELAGGGLVSGDDTVAFTAEGLMRYERELVQRLLSRATALAEVADIVADMAQKHRAAGRLELAAALAGEDWRWALELQRKHQLDVCAGRAEA